MRLMLINPSMNFSRSMGWYAPMMEPAPCIGLARLAAVARQNGHEVRVIDAYSEHLSVEQTAAQTVVFQPDVIGLSVLTASAPFCERLTDILRRRLPAAKIVLGNVHAGVFAEELIVQHRADVVAHGEAEHSFARLLTVYESGGDLGDIPGITYAREGQPATTPPPGEFIDLDTLPRPAWDLLPYHNYGMLPFVTMAKPALMVEGSRGCPFNCRFCALRHMGQIYRHRDPAGLADEMAWLVRDFGARMIAFADSIFPLTEKQAFALSEELRRVELGNLVWATEIRTDLVTEPLITALKNVQLTRVLFGIESGSQSSLDRVDKKLTVAQTRRAVEICRRQGVQAVGFFILGLPEETEADLEATVRLALELPLDIVKFNVTIPYPGSQLFDDARAAGTLRHTDWEDYSCYVTEAARLPLVTANVSGEYLLAKQRQAIRRFYLRPKTIAAHLLRLRTVPLRFLALAAYNLTREALAEGYQRTFKPRKRV